MTHEEREQALSEEDYIELRHRFGTVVESVVRDMVSGKGERWEQAQAENEDAISREAVLDMLEDINAETEGVGFYYEHYVDYIKALPSVKPQEKTGHWIMKHRTHNEVKHYTGQDEMGETHTISVLERYEVNEHYCSECGKRAGDTSQNYCCACGAKMIER